MLKEPNADYDNPWKEAIGDYFEQFLEFFFPQVRDLIDWTRTPQSLDKELQQITASSGSGLRIADKLFRVWLPEEGEVWILIHVEVQSQYDADFVERMYVYHYRAFDLYKKPVISLAILGDESKTWRPSSYGYNLGGCSIDFQFPTVKLVDYEACWSDLETSPNPFATVVMAHLKTKATTGNPTAREQWKWRLVRQLNEQGYSRQNIILLFQLIDRMMALPKELQQQFNTKYKRYEEEKTMPLLSHIEEEAMERATRQNTQSNIISLLSQRFEAVPLELKDKIASIEDIEQLQSLLLQTITVNSVAEFQQLLSQEDNN